MRPRLRDDRDRAYDYLKKIGYRNAVLPGAAAAWRTFPEAASPARLTASATPNIDGVITSIIASGAVTVPYWFTNLGGTYINTNHQSSQIALSSYEDGRTLHRRVLVGNIHAGLENPPFTVNIMPMPIPPSARLDAVIASTDGSEVIDLYATVLVREPSLMMEAIPTIRSVSNLKNYPGNDGSSGDMIALTANAGSWTYGPTLTVLDGTNDPASLLTAIVLLNDDPDNNMQVSFLCNAVEFGVWGFPTNPQLAALDQIMLRYELNPPFYLPAGKTVTARLRSNGASKICQVGVETINIPF